MMIFFMNVRKSLEGSQLYMSKKINFHKILTQINFIFLKNPRRSSKKKNCWMLERCQVESERNQKVCMGNSMNKSLHLHPFLVLLIFTTLTYYTKEREERYTWRYERKANSLKLREEKMHSTNEWVRGKC